MVYLDGPWLPCSPFGWLGKLTYNLKVVQGQVQYPGDIAFVQGQCELAGPLLLQLDAGQPTDLMVFLRRTFDGKRLSELQRQVAAGIAQAVDTHLAASLAGKASGIELQGQPRQVASEVRAINYWAAGQKCAQRHLQYSWSCAFDGTRVGGRSVLATCFCFPTNYALWVPMQEKQ